MGSFLDKPIVEKETIAGSGNGIYWGCSCMQGWRVEMEDAHTCETNVPGRPGTSFFAVYDGHGGSLVAKLAADKLLPHVQNTASYKSGDKGPETMKKALYDGILTLDSELRTEPKLESGEDHSGATAITSMLTPTHIIIGNTGDSRAVLVRGDDVHFASVDHKPTDAGERERVEKAGGFIEMGRVCGNLAVSRALGDFQYKDKPSMSAEEQKITAAADMTVIERSQDDEYLLLCCDGIWDVMTNQQAKEFVTDHLKGGFKAPEICERLMDHCLHKNSKDNMSVLLVLFSGAPKEVKGHVVQPLASPEGPDEDQDETQKRLSTAVNQLVPLLQAGVLDPSQADAAGPPAQDDDTDEKDDVGAGSEGSD